MQTLSKLSMAATLSLVLAACGTTAPTNFYTLTPTASEKTEQVGPESDISVGIGPVVLADYLDRPQVVTRLGSNQMNLEDFDTWVEPLDAIIRRVMVRDIGIMLDSQFVVALPDERFVPIDYRVDLVINRFDSGPSPEVFLEARWAVIDDSDGDLIPKGEDVFVAEVRGNHVLVLPIEQQGR